MGILDELYKSMADPFYWFKREAMHLTSPVKATMLDAVFPPPKKESGNSESSSDSSSGDSCND